MHFDSQFLAEYLASCQFTTPHYNFNYLIIQVFSIEDIRSRNVGKKSDNSVKNAERAGTRPARLLVLAGLVQVGVNIIYDLCQ